MILLSLQGVRKAFGSNEVLRDASLVLQDGQRMGLVGVNGCGKSTLMKIIAGIEKEYQGEVVWAPGYTVGYLEQDPKLDPNKTVREVVQEGVQPIMDMLKEYDDIK